MPVQFTQVQGITMQQTRSRLIAIDIIAHITLSFAIGRCVSMMLVATVLALWC